jgi:replication factor A1
VNCFVNNIHFDWCIEWYEREGNSVTTNSLSKSGSEGNKDTEWKFLSQINEQTVGNDNRTYFNVRARVVQTGRQPLYKACGQNGCLKKVRDNNNGFYHCDKCQTDSSSFEWRLILSVAISDCTGEGWVTIFQEQAEKILGISVKELSELQENNPQEFLKALTVAEFKQYVFRIGSKIEHYMDESRVKSVAFNFTPVDAIKHSKQLIKNINEWTN